MYIEVTPVKRPTAHVRWVWKVFNRRTSPSLALCAIQQDCHIQRGVWVKSYAGPGFYAGLTPEAAKVGAFWDAHMDIIMKVRVRRINGRNENTITAEEIFIPRGRAVRA